MDEDKLTSIVEGKVNKEELDNQESIISDSENEEIFNKGFKAFQLQDYKTAAPFVTSSAKNGHKMAQVLLGTMYKEGLFFSKNDKEALKWFEKSANQDEAMGQFQLGYMYYLGEGGLKVNNYKTYELWTKSSNQGFVTAEENLEVLCSEDPIVCE